jgi:hypothetical protein
MAKRCHKVIMVTQLQKQGMGILSASLKPGTQTHRFQKTQVKAYRLPVADFLLPLYAQFHAEAAWLRAQVAHTAPHRNRNEA